MRSKSDLFDAQKAAVGFGLQGRDMLLLAAIGYGKTAIVWTLIQDFINRGVVDRFLVLAPMRVARLVWPYEREQWEHLQYLRIAVAAGEPARKRRDALESDAHVVTLNYENVRWLYDQFGRLSYGGLKHPLLRDQRWGLVLDEVDKMKAPGTARFKAMRAMLPFFSSRLGLTGTPTPNHLHEIWGQAYCVAEKECGLGTSYTKFKEKYFYAADYHGYTVKPHVYAEEEIYGAIAPYTYRLGDDDSGRSQVVNDVFVELTGEHRRAYDQMEEELIAMLPDLDDPVVAASAAAKSQKLVQLASGFVYYEEEGTIGAHKKCGRLPQKWDCGCSFGCDLCGYGFWCKKCGHAIRASDRVTGGRQAKVLSNAKMSVLADLVSELQGEQLIVVYNYLETKAQLEKAFPRMRFLGSGKEGDDTITEWNAGAFDLLGIHPQSAGHGLNLHLGGCKNLVYVTLPWSGGLYEQTNGRIDRRGQGGVVYLHRLIAKGTIDERIVEVLGTKQQGNKALLAAMKRWTEERGRT